VVTKGLLGLHNELSGHALWRGMARPTARKDQNTYTVILGTVRKDDISLDRREVQFVMVEVVASAGVHFFTPLRRILVVLVTVETRAAIQPAIHHGKRDKSRRSRVNLEQLLLVRSPRRKSVSAAEC
jgi:hypothetical protein